MLTLRDHMSAVHQIIEDDLSLCSLPDYRELILAVVRDRVASASAGTPWFMLPVFTCEALGGDVAAAHHVAAGLEIGRIAAGCLDEWQDHDTEDALWQTIGPERTVSVATGMIALSFLALNRLTDLGTEPELVLGLKRAFDMALLRMSEGQHADLSDDVALGEYEAVAGAKSGALFRLGCQAGAMVARAPDGVVKRYGDFGHDLGILVQVWNDISGLSGTLGKNDAEQRRGLPIVAALALDQAGEESEYQAKSVEGQAGQIYALLQLAVLYQRTSEALGKCPALGRLKRFLDEYDPGRLADTIGPSSQQDAEPHEQ